MLFGARHGDSEHGARSTFIFAASLARSRPKSRRLSFRRALRAARPALGFLSASFSRTIAPWAPCFLSQINNPQSTGPNMQVVVQKTTFPQAARAGARDVKNSERTDLLSKNCSLNRDVECPSVGTIFAHSFSERSAMAVRLQFAAKKAPNLSDRHVGSRVR